MMGSGFAANQHPRCRRTGIRAHSGDNRNDRRRRDRIAASAQSSSDARFVRLPATCFKHHHLFHLPRRSGSRRRRARTAVWIISGAACASSSEGDRFDNTTEHEIARAAVAMLFAATIARRTACSRFAGLARSLRRPPPLSPRFRIHRKCYSRPRTFSPSHAGNRRVCLHPSIHETWLVGRLIINPELESGDGRKSPFPEPQFPIAYAPAKCLRHSASASRC